MISDSINETLRRLQEAAKRLKDREEGWAFEEAKGLKVKFRNEVTREIHAEIHRENNFGFNPQTAKTTVKMVLDAGFHLPKDAIQDGRFPDCISLYEDAKPFGNEGGWKIASIRDEEQGRFAFFFSD